MQFPAFAQENSGSQNLHLSFQTFRGLWESTRGIPAWDSLPARAVPGRPQSPRYRAFPIRFPTGCQYLPEASRTCVHKHVEARSRAIPRRYKDASAYVRQSPESASHCPEFRPPWIPSPLAKAQHMDFPQACNPIYSKIRTELQYPIFSGMAKSRVNRNPSQLFDFHSEASMHPEQMQNPAAPEIQEALARLGRDPLHLCNLKDTDHQSYLAYWKKIGRDLRSLTTYRIAMDERKFQENWLESSRQNPFRRITLPKPVRSWNFCMRSGRTQSLSGLPDRIADCPHRRPLSGLLRRILPECAWLRDATGPDLSGDSHLGRPLSPSPAWSRTETGSLAFPG